MRILFVAMTFSIHTKRWLDNLVEQGWDIHLFPVDEGPLYDGFHDITLQDFAYYRPRSEIRQLKPSIRLDGLYSGTLKSIRSTPIGHWVVNTLLPTLNPHWANRAWRLAQTIKRIKPDIIHSLEIQHASYLTKEAYDILLQDDPQFKFPKWIVSNWGSDIYLFGRFPEHEEKIRALLGLCDFYLCECQRDVELGEHFGFAGQVLPVLPVAGSHRLEQMRMLREPGARSDKRLIVLKGYQNWAGRALIGLRALELCADLIIKGQYEIAIYLPNSVVTQSAQFMSARTGIPIRVQPYGSHDEILRLHGQARVSIGLGISDGISTSFLETLIMGSFPIQSNTGCGNEWVQNGMTGFLVPAEDPNIVAEAIRIALTDDDLVNNAMQLNDATVNQRLAYSVLQPQIVDLYSSVYAAKTDRHASTLN